MTDAYPLQWPAGRPRTENRRDGAFRGVNNARSTYGVRTDRNSMTVAQAMPRLQRQVELLGARYLVVSSNLELRLDGLPRSGQKDPADPGVAVYFQLGGKPHCLPCDTFTSVAQNIAAVAAHIEASRKIERYGVASVSEIFAGFLALPAPDAARPWRQVLELHREPAVTIVIVEAAYRRLARERHPDAGGTDSMMAELNRARDDARRELGS